MTTSTTEDATSRKRSRMLPTGSEYTTPATAATGSPSTLLGTRLEPIMDLLESQPDELKEHLIVKIKTMLDDRVTIQQRSKTYARFSKPSTDSTTGAVLLDEAGTPLPFIPSTLRLKCPIKASDTTKDDSSMKQVLDEAAAAHATYQIAMTAIAKRTAAMEISIRQSTQRKTAFEMCDLISITYIVIHDVRQDLRGEKRTSQLTQLQLAHKTTYDVLRDATPHLLDALEVCDTATLMAEYATHNSYTDSVVESALSDEENELIKPIITKMNTWLPRFTHNLWEHLDAKEEKKAINAALRIALQPKAMLAATLAVEDAMETEDPNEIPPTLLEAIRKEQQKLSDKQMVVLKKQLRKNCSAEDKTKSSSAIKNGPKSGKTSTAAAKKKKAAATSKQGKKVTFTKTTKEDAAPTKAPKKKPPKKSPGSRGGSKKGAKTRSAAGR